jgi:hypothetical protein
MKDVFSCSIRVGRFPFKLRRLREADRECRHREGLTCRFRRIRNKAEISFPVQPVRSETRREPQVHASVSAGGPF